MNRVAKDLLIAGSIYGTVIVTYGYYVAQLRVQDDRLLAVVQEKLATVAIPTGSTFVYQEAEVSRSCKTSEVRRLYSTGKAPEAIRESIGCRSTTDNVR